MDGEGIFCDGCGCVRLAMLAAWITEVGAKQANTSVFEALACPAGGVQLPK